MRQNVESLEVPRKQNISNDRLRWKKLCDCRCLNSIMRFIATSSLSQQNLKGSRAPRGMSWVNFPSHVADFFWMFDSLMLFSERRFLNEMQNIPILLRNLAETPACQLSSLYQTSGLKKLNQDFRQDLTSCLRERWLIDSDHLMTLWLH